MKKRMSANSLSAWEEMQKELKESHREIINVFRNDASRPLDSYQVADRIRKSNGDTKPRLTELYQLQWLKIVDNYTASNGRVRALYQLRLPSDPLNVIAKTELEILTEKLEAVKWMYGIETDGVERAYRAYVERHLQMQLEL